MADARWEIGMKKLTAEAQRGRAASKLLSLVERRLVVVKLITADEATRFRVGIPHSTFLLSLRGKPANTPAA
jgi:hypothetical protein